MTCPACNGTRRPRLTRDFLAAGRALHAARAPAALRRLRAAVHAHLRLALVERQVAFEEVCEVNERMRRQVRTTARSARR